MFLGFAARIDTFATNFALSRSCMQCDVCFEFDDKFMSQLTIILCNTFLDYRVVCFEIRYPQGPSMGGGRGAISLGRSLWRGAKFRKKTHLTHSWAPFALFLAPLVNDF